jgi:transcriptional regulator with XRE-family HTH domain
MLRVKEILKEKGKTQIDLASDLSVTPIGLNKIINGNPTIETLQKIATALNVEVVDLFDPSSKKKKPKDKIFNIINELESIKSEFHNELSIMDLLKKTNFVYEEKNSFKNSEVPCYYYKNSNGYNVYFIFPNEVVDFGVYDLNKNLVSLIIDIHNSLKDEYKEAFVTQSALSV